MRPLVRRVLLEDRIVQRSRLVRFTDDDCTGGGMHANRLRIGRDRKRLLEVRPGVLMQAHCRTDLAGHVQVDRVRPDRFTVAVDQRA